MSTNETEKPEQAVRYVTSRDAKQRLGHIIAAVHYRGERVVITKHGKPVAALVPALPSDDPSSEAAA